ncbi:MAG: Smr/MutS family protein [bacterium]
MVDAEIDLHGLRTSEVRLRLVPFLDRGYSESWQRVKIIHGKGSGALKNRIATILDELFYVKSYRSGYIFEGGSGITVVEFREDHDE